uniref:Uncharacterized protein n=1 Tax=Corvus moneduloides TaxID=1196302 RepID=A0A8C3DUR4_CORMO
SGWVVRMRLLPAALALLLLLSSSVPAGGECLLTNMRCKCIKSTAHVINLGLILTIDVTPPVGSLETNSCKLLVCALVQKYIGEKALGKGRAWG